MKTQKFDLKNLKVQSFVTSASEEIKGGVGETQKYTYCAAPGGCSWYCPSGFEC